MPAQRRWAGDQWRKEWKQSDHWSFVADSPAHTVIHSSTLTTGYSPVESWHEAHPLETAAEEAASGRVRSHAFRWPEHHQSRPFCFVGRLSLHSECPWNLLLANLDTERLQVTVGTREGGLAECISSADIPKAHLGRWSFQSQVAPPGPLSKLLWFSAARSSRKRSCTFTASPQKRTWGVEQLLQQQNENDF